MEIVKSGSWLSLFFIASLQVANAVDAMTAFNAARRYFGPEEALTQVNSIHLTGHVIAEDSGERAELNIVFAKPNMSWMQIQSKDFAEIVVVNKIEGFVHRKHMHSGESKVSVLPAIAASRMQNVAWQRLNFFASPQPRFAKAKSYGMAEVGGTLCNKVVVNYPGGLWTAFYFDKDSGRHLVSHSDNGLRFVKSGEIVTNNIRFPKQMTVFEKDKEVRRMVFKKIEVNRPVDLRIFEFPKDS